MKLVLTNLMTSCRNRQFKPNWSHCFFHKGFFESKNDSDFFR